MARPHPSLASAALLALHLCLALCAAASIERPSAPLAHARPAAASRIAVPDAIDDATLAAAAPPIPDTADPADVSAALAAELAHARAAPGGPRHALPDADGERGGARAGGAARAAPGGGGAGHAALLSRLVRKPGGGAPPRSVFAAYAAERARRGAAAADVDVARVARRAATDAAAAAREERARRAALARDPDRRWRNAPQHLYTGYTYRPPRPRNGSAGAGAPAPPAPGAGVSDAEAARADPPHSEEVEVAAPAAHPPLRADVAARAARAPVVAPGGIEHDRHTEGDEHLTDEQLEAAKERVALLSAASSSEGLVKVFAAVVMAVLAVLGLLSCARNIGGKGRRSFMRKLRAPVERDVEV